MHWKSEVFNGVGEVANFVDRLDGVHDLEINQGIDFCDDVVFGDHILLGEVVHVFPQVNAVLHFENRNGFAVEARFAIAPRNLTWLVDDRNDNVDPGLEGSVVFTQSFDDHGFGLFDDPNSFGQKENDQEGDK